MKSCSKYLICLIALFPLFISEAEARQQFTGADGVEVAIDDFSRIISVGSAITETIFALDAGENVIAVDESSVYPETVRDLEQVSYTRTLSAEGILSLSPTVILASSVAGPPSTIAQIRRTDIPLLKFTADETVEGAFERVRELGNVFGREDKAEEIISGMQQTLAEAKRMGATVDELSKVMFIYARGPNTLMVAGNNTSANTMIELAAGKNAFNDFDDYKPLTAEAVVSANPDVILMMNTGFEVVGSKEGVLQAPGIRMTNAAKEDRIHSMDGNYLLGFGPRMGGAVLDLMQLLHPDMEVNQGE